MQNINTIIFPETICIDKRKATKGENMVCF